MFTSRHRLSAAISTLRAGGLVAHPTEGVWGLACDPSQPHAVMRLLTAKRRDPRKGLILLAADSSQITPWIDHAVPELLQRAQADWPGPVTWVLPASPDVARWLRGEHTSIATRVTAHPVAAALAGAFGGALVSSSANLAGRPAAQAVWQVRAQLRDSVDFLLAGELQTPGKPSTIKSAQDGRVLRA